MDVLYLRWKDGSPEDWAVALNDAPTAMMKADDTHEPRSQKE